MSESEVGGRCQFWELGWEQVLRLAKEEDRKEASVPGRPDPCRLGYGDPQCEASVSGKKFLACPVPPLGFYSEWEKMLIL